MLFSVQVLPAHRDLANHHVARVDRVARHVDLEMRTMLRAHQVHYRDVASSAALA